jgi:hypothetical protein
MYNLGIPGDVNNAIFMNNAYPWRDVFGVLYTDDFSKRTNANIQVGGVMPPAAGPQAGQGAPAQSSHLWLWIVAIVALAIYLFNR